MKKLILEILDVRLISLITALCESATIYNNLIKKALQC